MAGSEPRGSGTQPPGWVGQHVGRPGGGVKRRLVWLEYSPDGGKVGWGEIWVGEFLVWSSGALA